MSTIDPERIRSLAQTLQVSIAGEVRYDLTTRFLYSTDASIYQIEPYGVIFPKQLDDLNAAVEICASQHVPVIVRGAGSGLAGQAIGKGWIIDCSRYLCHILEIDQEARCAVVEPGVVINTLNLAAKKFGLQFGPDPASAERATFGGSLANNAAGAHSIRYGMAADHLLETELVLSDGSQVWLRAESLAEAGRKSALGKSREAALYTAALNIRERFGDILKRDWPYTWRRASGYNLNYLLPWSPSQPTNWFGDHPADLDSGGQALPYPPVQNGMINLAALIAGSEGTLGVIRKAVIRLVPIPKHSVLLVLSYRDIVDACQDVPKILEVEPSAVELIPPNLIKMARSVPAYAAQLGFITPLIGEREEPPALLAIEFSGNDLNELIEQANRLKGGRAAILADSIQQQRQIWGIRKVGLGLFLSRPGDEKPWSFIEDLSVPAEKLGKFTFELMKIMEHYGVECEIYGHASAGCLHVRPIINLKTLQGVEMMRRLATETVELTLELGGAVSGEHGDGLARSEWNERMFGKGILEAFRYLKGEADPDGILNPGKIVSSKPDDTLPKMDMNLRFARGYQTRGWRNELDFSKQGGLAQAIELCNGAGVCRKSEGVMCPSFQGMREEMHSTRGRANLLRGMISGQLPMGKLAQEKVFEALDLCLSCKGCKAECPSGVDMAKLKYEFMNFYYSQHRRRLRDYLFGYIGTFARFAQPLYFLANPIMATSVFRNLSDRLFGLSSYRVFPSLASQTLTQRWKAAEIKPFDSRTGSYMVREGEKVLLLLDAFTEYFFPHVGISALKALDLLNCEVVLLPVIGAGRPLISKGFLKAARRHASLLLEAIWKADPEGICPIIGLEPSEILTLEDEYPDLFPGDERTISISKRAYTIEEYLIRPMNNLWGSSTEFETRLMRIVNNLPSQIEQTHTTNKNKTTTIHLHGHCYQKAQLPTSDGFPRGVGASVSLLEQAGFEVDLIESGCCGMAGAFGYESEHFDLSQQIGELTLFPVVRRTDPDSIIAASGVSCRAQIQDGTGRMVYHPVEVIFLQAK